MRARSYNRSPNLSSSPLERSLEVDRLQAGCPVDQSVPVRLRRLPAGTPRQPAVKGLELEPPLPHPVAPQVASGQDGIGGAIVGLEVDCVLADRLRGAMRRFHGL